MPVLSLHEIKKDPDGLLRALGDVYAEIKDAKILIISDEHQKAMSQVTSIADIASMISSYPIIKRNAGYQSINKFSNCKRPALLFSSPKSLESDKRISGLDIDAIILDGKESEEVYNEIIEGKAVHLFTLR